MWVHKYRRFCKKKPKSMKQLTLKDMFKNKDRFPYNSDNSGAHFST